MTSGTTVFFDVVVDSGDPWGIVAYPYNYPGGTGYANGVADPNDLWFREGIVVPEPGTCLMLFAGFGALILRCRPRE